TDRRRGRRRRGMIVDLIAWILSFFILLAVMALVLYQIMCFLDLEIDYINPYELATKINNITLPEFITQGALCFLHLVARHWIIRHLVYATEVFSELSREKKQRIFKLWNPTNSYDSHRNYSISN
ncbi:hypothetical protein M8C21_004804, partial [Ambrosia artemisiifolia]